MRPRTADDGPPVNPERSRLPSTDRRPQSAVRLNQHPDRSLPESVRDMPRQRSGRAPKVFGTYSPIPHTPILSFPHAPTPARFKRGCYPCGYKSYRRRTAGATGRLWGALDLKGRISRVPRSDRRNRGSVNQWSTKMRTGKTLAQFLRLRGLHMRTMHRATAETGFRLGGLPARKTVSAVRVPAINTF